MTCHLPAIHPQTGQAAPAPTASDRARTVAEVAAYLQLTPRTIRRWVRAGLLRMTAGDQIPQAAVAELLRAHERGALAGVPKSSPRARRVLGVRDPRK